jgi:5'-nucleotidase
MTILISNDDGVHAPGIRALVKHLRQFTEVFVMAPDRDRSGASHSLTLDRPLRVTELENGFYSINGTPKDCVHLAVTAWLPSPPSMVISGINHGYNLGGDVIYSGTVAAAMEGNFLGIPSLAISLAYKDNNPTYFETAAEVAKILMFQHQKHPLPSGTLLNINVPDVPFKELKGFKVCRLGTRERAEPIIQAEDARGRKIYWVGESGAALDAGPDTDFWAINNNMVSITPLHSDLTKYTLLEDTKGWTEDIFFSPS